MNAPVTPQPGPMIHAGFSVLSDFSVVCAHLVPTRNHTGDRHPFYRWWYTLVAHHTRGTDESGRVQDARPTRSTNTTIPFIYSVDVHTCGMGYKFNT